MRAPSFSSERARVGRRDLCVSHDGPAKECAFSLALQGGEASGLAICTQAASHHFGGHCLGKKKSNQDQYKKTVGNVMTCPCPEPRQEQSTPVSRALAVAEGGKVRSPAVWGAWRCPCGSQPGTRRQERGFRTT